MQPWVPPVAGPEPEPVPLPPSVVDGIKGISPGGVMSLRLRLLVVHCPLMFVALTLPVPEAVQSLPEPGLLSPGVSAGISVGNSGISF